MRELLNYLVDEALGERAPRLKEFAIATAVFGRDETFDPGSDAVVRVEVGRLRSKLQEYYAEAGAGDRIRIDIPKGAYVPTFGTADNPARPNASGGRFDLARILAAIGVVAGIAIALAIWAPIDPQQIATPGTEIQRLAVLPLRDWSADPQGYFSEAFTDALIARLSERPELRVISFGSVIAYAESGMQPAEIAAQLGVDAIVAGTVFRESDYVRITANLIDASDGTNIWTNTYTRPMTSVLALQANVASEIASQLAGRLSESDDRALPEIDPLAYEAFMKGLHWRNRLTAHGFNRGIVYLQEAVRIQPDYAEAYAAMAACHCQLGGHGIEIVAPEIAISEARSLADKALELDKNLALPNAVMGIVKFKYDWDPVAAEIYLQRAVENNPSLYEAYLWRSQVAEGLGRHEIAVEQARIAYGVNPRSLAAGLNLGWQLFQAKRIDEAERKFDDLLDFDPDFWGAHWAKGHVLRSRGQYSDAIVEFTRAVELEQGHSLASAALGYTYAIAGQRELALSVLADLEAQSGQGYVSPAHIAMVYAGLGDNDAAFAWLDAAVRMRARTLAWINVTAEFESLRGDPRYDDLIKLIGIG